MKNLRINIVFIFILIFAATLLGRLVFVQIIEHDLYAALARGQQKFFISSQGDRGEIFFKNHDLPIATNRDSYFVFASPDEIPSEEKEEIAQVLSQALGMSENIVLEKLKQSNLYEMIKEEVTEEELNKLEELSLNGIYSKKERVREYPYNTFGAHLLGFVNKDGQGQYGLEEYWDNNLQGKEQFSEGERGPLGYFFPQRSPDQGSDLILTIDYNIQYLAEKLLDQARTNLDISGGTILVMEPFSGKLLALANFPTFDPNQYSSQKDFFIFQNDAIQKIFEPGSVFKPITMASAIDKGKITPQTTYFDPGCLKISGYDICNYEERIYEGELTMTNVLEKSINTGAVFAQSQLGNNNFLDYLKRFGIFKDTGIALEGEIYSSNAEIKKGYEINFATASFGQGIEMTPIQLARAFSAIANGGKLIKPYLVERMINSDGKVTEYETEITSSNVISPSTASKVTAMLVSVVENGFAKAAKVPGYYVAGKTGTAQISFAALGENKRGYSEKTWQSFVGFAPAFDPRFLILVKLNNPATKTAEYSAIPIFQELAKYIVDYHQIPPDYE